MNQPQPGAIGVMLWDHSAAPTLWRMLNQPNASGLAMFEPLHERGAMAVQNVADFWPLLDRMPA